MKAIAGLAIVVLAAIFNPATTQAALITQWTFETSNPVLADSPTIGGISAEVGSGTASGVHTSAATDWTSPAGNGSSRSFSANTWAVGDYFQFRVSTVGYENISVSWDQTGSGTGPRDFVLRYSTDGLNFTTFGSQYSVLLNGAPNTAWNGTTASSVYNFARDLGSIIELNDASDVYFRLVMNSTVSINNGVVAAGGTDRVDNFAINGDVIPVPEPTTIALGIFAGGLLALSGARALKKKQKTAGPLNTNN